MAVLGRIFSIWPCFFHKNGHNLCIGFSMSLSVHWHQQWHCYWQWKGTGNGSRSSGGGNVQGRGSGRHRSTAEAVNGGNGYKEGAATVVENLQGRGCGSDKGSC